MRQIVVRAEGNSKQIIFKAHCRNSPQEIDDFSAEIWYIDNFYSCLSKVKTPQTQITSRAMRKLQKWL